MSKQGWIVRTIFSCAVLLLQGFWVSAQSALPPPNAMLFDGKHKEPKSGVEVRGNMITIRSGVGTPTTVNVLAFSKDGKLLAAGKDFGRVALWNVPKRLFIGAIDTKQGIIRAVAISPDNQIIATAGQSDATVKLWRLSDRRLVKILKLENSSAQRLAFGPAANRLMIQENSGTIYVLNLDTGKDAIHLPGEWDPVLSTDGKALMTVDRDEVILRDTNDWKEEKKLPKLTKYEYPFALDTQSDMYIYGDATDENSFVAVILSSGEPLPNPHMSKLPRLNLAAGGFAAIDPQSTLVFGHSDDRLWVWNTTTGKTCISSPLYSESGALSPDGKFVAAGIGNSILGKERVRPGVGIWEVDSIRKSCGI